MKNKSIKEMKDLLIGKQKEFIKFQEETIKTILSEWTETINAWERSVLIFTILIALAFISGWFWGMLFK